MTVVMDATKLADGGPYAVYKKQTQPLGLYKPSSDSSGLKLTHCRWGQWVGNDQVRRFMMAKTTVNLIVKLLGFYYPNTTIKSAFDCRREGNSGTVGRECNEPEGKKCYQGGARRQNDKAHLYAEALKRPNKKLTSKTGAHTMWATVGPHPAR